MKSNMISPSSSLLIVGSILLVSGIILMLVETPRKSSALNPWNVVTNGSAFSFTDYSGDVYQGDFPTEEEALFQMRKYREYIESIAKEANRAEARRREFKPLR